MGSAQIAERKIGIIERHVLDHLDPKTRGQAAHALKLGMSDVINITRAKSHERMNETLKAHLKTVKPSGLELAGSGQKQVLEQTIRSAQPPALIQKFIRYFVP